MKILEIEHFSKAYDSDKKAVNDISLTVNSGEIYGFIGHNGAGKSTTIKAIVGILSVREGDVKVCGKSVRTNLRECQQMTGYLPDNPDIYEFMTGIEYINFVCDIFSVSGEDRTARVKKYADAFEITQNLGDLISSYSHGMKQKVALIAAFAHQPKLLVLDEPFVGLDPMASATLKRCMRELCQEGSAIFFSTHVLDVAEKLCDKIGMIDHGNMVLNGTVEELTRERSLEDAFLRVLGAAHE